MSFYHNLLHVVILIKQYDIHSSMVSTINVLANKASICNESAFHLCSSSWHSCVDLPIGMRYGTAEFLESVKSARQ